MAHPPIKSSNITATEAQPAGVSSIDRPAEKTGGGTAMPASELLTIPECMAIGNFGKTSLYNLAAKGAFPIVKIGRSSRVPRQRFLDFLHGLPTAQLRVPSALSSEPNADSDECK